MERLNVLTMDLKEREEFPIKKWQKDIFNKVIEENFQI